METAATFFVVLAAPSTVVNALASGLLVSYGGSFFNEALGAVREFKKTQEYVRGAGRRAPR